jgi:hypothetical protein
MMNDAPRVINSLMARLMEDPIRIHMRSNSNSSGEAAGVVRIARTGLKTRIRIILRRRRRNSPFSQTFYIFSTPEIQSQHQKS